MKLGAVKLNGNGTFSETEYSQLLDPTNDRKMLALGLTTAPGCNLSCVYCYTSGGKTDIPKTEWMGSDDYKRAIDQAASLGARTVVIDGIGEPLLDPNIRPILSQIYENGMTPLLATNGTLLGEGNTADFLYQVGASLFISMESLDNDTYSTIVGREGMLPKTLEGIETCIQRGYGGVREKDGHKVTDIMINAMAMRVNIAEISRLKEFCDEKGILFAARVPGHVGSATGNWGRIVGDVDERRRLEETLSGLVDKEEVFQTPYGCLFWTAGNIMD